VPVTEKVDTVADAGFTVTPAVFVAVVMKLGSSPVLLNVAVTVEVPKLRIVLDVGLQVPEPDVKVIVQSVVAPCVTDTLSVLGIVSPWAAVTVAWNTRLVSAPYEAGLPVTVKADTVAESGLTARFWALEPDVVKFALPA
jgi:hypothetical protein